MQFPKNPIIKDALVTGALALVVLAVVWGAGGAVHDAGPVSSLEREARTEKISFIKKQTILSHTEETLPSGNVVVRYTYLGEKLPEKLAEDEVLALRTESSWSRQTGVEKDGRAIYETRIFASPQYVFHKDNWYSLESGTAPVDTFKRAKPSLLFSFFPFSIAHAQTLDKFSGDADGYVSSLESTWANAQGTSTGAAVDSAGEFINVGSFHHTNAGKLDFLATGYHIYRGFLPFDTSVIPAGANISSASLNVMGTSSLFSLSLNQNTDNDGLDYITVVQTSQGGITNLTIDDFDQAGIIDNPIEGIDSAQRKDITSIATTTSTYTTFTLNSTGRSWIKKKGETSSCGQTNPYIFLTNSALSTWTVPDNWNSSNNSIETIGSGGAGGAGSGSGAAGGGGGGAYSKVTNVSLTPGATVAYNVGTSSLLGTGTDTYFCNFTSNCASIAGSAVVVGAKAGANGTTGAGGAGGASASGIGSTKYSGGNGGTPSSLAGSGGGGAAGKNGAGQNGGGGGGTSPRGGGGGGGNGNGAAGSAGVSDGGAGGNGYLGSGAGAGGVVQGGVGVNGSLGGGGGGGAGSTAGATAAGGGGWGGTGTEWDAGNGSGGGGGGGGQHTVTGGTNGAGGLGGLWGGGGGGGGGATNGGPAGGAGPGRQGIIVIEYAGSNLGLTCLGLREGHDTTDSAIDLNKGAAVAFSSSGAVGTSQDPYLSVVYSAGVAFWQFQDF